MKTYSLEEMIDKHIGKPGTPNRDAFENELRLDLLGEAIKQARKERHLYSIAMNLQSNILAD
jgi:hypothetical protein